MTNGFARRRTGGNKSSLPADCRSRRRRLIDRSIQATACVEVKRRRQCLPCGGAAAAVAATPTSSWAVLCVLSAATCLNGQLSRTHKPEQFVGGAARGQSARQLPRARATCVTQ